MHFSKKKKLVLILTHIMVCDHEFMNYEFQIVFVFALF